MLITPYSPEQHPSIANPSGLAEHIRGQAHQVASGVLDGQAEVIGDQRFVTMQVGNSRGQQESLHLLATGPSPQRLAAGYPKAIVQDPKSHQPIEVERAIPGMWVEAVHTREAIKETSRRFRLSGGTTGGTESRTAVIITPKDVPPTFDYNPQVGTGVAEFARGKSTDIVNPTVLTEVVKRPDGSEKTNKVRVGDDRLGRPVVEVVHLVRDSNNEPAPVEVLRLQAVDTSEQALRIQTTALEISERVLKSVVLTKPVQ